MDEFIIPSKIVEVRFDAPDELLGLLENKLLSAERRKEFDRCHAHIFSGLPTSASRPELERYYQSMDYTPEPYFVDFYVSVTSLVEYGNERIIFPIGFISDEKTFEREVIPKLVKRIGKVEWN